MVREELIEFEGWAPRERVKFVTLGGCLLTRPDSTIAEPDDLEIVRYNKATLFTDLMD